MSHSRQIGTARRVARLAFVLVVALGGRGTILYADEFASVRLMVGRSAVVNMDSPIARVSLTSADVADAMVTLPNQLLIQGKLPGTISMFVWDRAGAMRRYDVTVERDLSRLTEQVRELFPGESIAVESNGKSIVLVGKVATKYIAEKAVEVAAGYVDKKDDVVSLLQVRDAGPTPQVLLRVRFAEVSRNALTELGASFFTGPNGFENFLGRGTTQQFPAPTFDNQNGDNKLVFSDFLNLFVFDMKNQLGAVIKALQTRGLFQSLAEPNLVAESGKEASFLAGGEFPIPVAQGGGANLAISVVFKEFGVRLNFTPTVSGAGRVRLKVRPEVSTLDFNNAIVLEGFRIPALSTRRTETEIELADGQTFAIAGLLNNTATQSLQKVPGIGDIPILGLLFRSKAAQKQQTELVVMITPQILALNSPGVTSELPRLIEPNLPPTNPNRSFPVPPPAFTTPKPSAMVAPTPAETAKPSAPVAPTPSEAAAVLSARLPKPPSMISKAELAAMPNPPTPAEPPAEPPAATPAEPPAAEPTSPAATAPTAPTRPSDPPRPTPAETKPTPAEEKELREIAKREAKAAENEKRRLQQEEKRKQELARKQAKRDAEAAQKQAKRDAEAAREQAKRDAEAAREQAKRDAEAAQKAERDSARQAEIEKKQQKVIEEAAARLKAAEAAYQVELAKKDKQ